LTEINARCTVNKTLKIKFPCFILNSKSNSLLPTVCFFCVSLSLYLSSSLCESTSVLSAVIMSVIKLGLLYNQLFKFCLRNSRFLYDIFHFNFLKSLGVTNFTQHRESVVLAFLHTLMHFGSAVRITSFLVLSLRVKKIGRNSCLRRITFM
jgi:hypothetical protein